MNRYKTQLDINLSIPDDHFIWMQGVFKSNSVNDNVALNIIKNGFEDMGSYYSMRQHYRFLYRKDNKFLYLSNNRSDKFNIEFPDTDTAIATLLKLKAIDELKFQLDYDQTSINFYLDSQSLKEIIDNYVFTK
jgi:hypothetical protein